MHISENDQKNGVFLRKYGKRKGENAQNRGFLLLQYLQKVQEIIVNSENRKNKKRVFGFILKIYENYRKGLNSSDFENKMDNAKAVRSRSGKSAAKVL